MVSRVFLVFMGAIITLQILPGLLTTSMSIRGGNVVRAKEAIRK